MLSAEHTILLGTAVVVASYILVDAVRDWSDRHNVVDVPNERSSHVRRTPRGGGIAIVAMTTAGLILEWVRRRDWNTSDVAGFLIGASIVALIGWLDDLYQVSYRIRLVAQTLAAGVLMAAVGSWNVIELPFIGGVALGWLGAAVTFVWLVGLTNAYNFMDGIDGLAGGQAVVAGAGWLVLGWWSDQSFVAVLGLLLAAGSLGFLGHNWTTARIFLGDVGSGYLGFAFATLGIIAPSRDPRLALAGVLLVWPFIFDSLFTLGRRAWRGERVVEPHRSHLYQRLVKAGCSHAAVSSVYIALAALGGLLALDVIADRPEGPLLVVAGVPLACLVLWTMVVARERRQAAWQEGGVSKEPS